jgi:hypothetical protein
MTAMRFKTNGLRSATAAHCSTVPLSSGRSHTRAVWSKLAVTTRVPSGLNAALTTVS